VQEPSFFSSEPFLGAVARTHFPGKPWQIETVEVEGRFFQVLTVRGKVIDDLWTHPSFYEPVAAAEGARCRTAPFLVRVLHEIVPAPALDLRWPFAPAPFVDWRPFATFAQFQEWNHARPNPAHWTTVRRASRNIGRHVGEVEFIANDPDPAAFATIVAWKSWQYRRHGLADRFALPKTMALYDELRDQGLLIVSTVRAGGRVIAGHAGYRWNRRFYTRLIAHDAELNRYSPGAVLLHNMLRESFDAGDEEFDLLQGGERYKWLYATHARVVGPIGRQPVAQRIEDRLRARVGSALLRLRERRRPVAVPGRG
jgi:hypothetical protein